MFIKYEHISINVCRPNFLYILLFSFGRTGLINARKKISVLYNLFIFSTYPAKSNAIFLVNSLIQIPNPEATRAAMSEVSHLLATVAGAHQLPLAQAWVRCKRCSSSSSTDTVHDDGDEHISLTTAGAPFHLTAGSGFRDACTEHHLHAGQGAVGEAAVSGSPSFCVDIARRSKAAYPLAHYARLHGLAGCLAVPLWLRRFAMHEDAGSEDEEECVLLEFFLPPDCRGVDEQKAAVEAVAATVREECSGDGLKAMSGLRDLSLEAVFADGVHTTTVADAAAHELNDHGDFGRGDSDEEDEHLAVDVAGGDLAVNIHGADQNGVGDGVSQPEKKKTGRKAGKPVGLKELQGYFSGSLKDAARSLGVCPTTMKRICRQHGISRWPFRKISKVNRALSKIRRAAIESEDCSPKPVAASSSHPAPDPQNLCLSSALGDTSSQGSSQEPPPLTRTALPKSLLRHSNGADREVVTIKASYRGDIIRFRVPCSSGITAVKEEVAKRLGLDASGFDVKYLDDDHEWVLLSCDADFQECLDVAPVLPPSASAAAHGARQVSPVVRLMVQEVADNLRRFCGSSD